MASHIKKGETIFIPFRNGQSISDSQLRPRMYKTMKAFEKSFPGHYLGNTDLEIAEYVEVVRCKDCKHGIWDEEEQMWECVLEVNLTGDLDTYSMFHEYNDGEHFCSYGERKDNES